MIGCWGPRALLRRRVSRGIAHKDRPHLAVAAIGLVVVVAVGCSESNRADDQRDPRATTTTEQATETTASQDTVPEEEVADAYLAAGEAFVRAGGEPDPDYPLEETHTGPMLEQARTIIEGLAADRLRFSYPPNSQADETVTSVEFRGDDVAILRVCTVDDGRRVRQDTGEVVVGGLSTVWADVAMERVDGTWKLAERRETRRRDGVAACDRED